MNFKEIPGDPGLWLPVILYGYNSIVTEKYVMSASAGPFQCDGQTNTERTNNGEMSNVCQCVNVRYNVANTKTCDVYMIYFFIIM